MLMIQRIFSSSKAISYLKILLLLIADWFSHMNHKFQQINLANITQTIIQSLHPSMCIMMSLNKFQERLKEILIDVKEDINRCCLPWRNQGSSS